MRPNRPIGSGPAAAVTAPRDPIAKVLVIFLLVEPTIDLFYFFNWQLGPFKIGPIHVAGLVFGAYLSLASLRLSGIKVPYAKVFFAFIVFNVISFSIGQTAVSPPGLVSFIEFMIKVGISFICYVAVFRAGVRWRYENVLPFLKYAFAGLTVPIIVNIVAIKIGYGGPKLGDQTITGSLRETGLYYDSGVLAIVALQGVVFGLALMFSKAVRGIFLRVLVVGIIVAAVYLIYLSLSRSVIILLGVSLCLFLLFNRGGLSRTVLSVGMLAALLAVIALNAVDLSRIEARFETEIGVVSALRSERDDQGFSGRVTFEGGVDDKIAILDQLGNNRGRIWRLQIEAIMERPLVYIMFGNFRGGAHSDYVDVLARNGVIGLVLYATLLLLILRLTIRCVIKGKDYQDDIVFLVALVLLVNYILYSVPFRPLSYSTPVWYMWIMLALTFSRQYQVAGKTASPEMQPKRIAPTFGVAIPTRAPAGRSSGTAR